MKGNEEGETSVSFADYLKGIEMCLKDLEKIARSAGLNELADRIEAARQEAWSATKKIN